MFATKDLFMSLAGTPVARLESITELVYLLTVHMRASWLLLTVMMTFFTHMGIVSIAAGGSSNSNVITALAQTFGLLCTSTVVWWLFGYAFATGRGAVYGGEEDRFVYGWSSFEGANATDIAYQSDEGSHFFATLCRCQVVLSYFSLAVVGRMRTLPFILSCAALSASVIPAVFHSLCSSHGWLSPQAPDSVGSGAIGGNVISLHVLGGAIGLAAGIIIGHRRLPGNVLRFSEEGVLLSTPHDKFLLGTGALFLWFGWFGITGQNGSELGYMPEELVAVPAQWLAAAHSIVFGLVGGCAAILAAYLVSYEVHGYLSIQFVLCSGVAGLTACSVGQYTPLCYAPLFGSVGTLVFFASQKLKMLVKWDDGLDVSSMFVFPGIATALLSGLLCDDDLYRISSGRDEVPGRGDIFGAQLLAVVAVLLLGMLGTMLILYCMDMLVDICPDSVMEARGLDEAQHGNLYCDYIKGFTDANEDEEEDLDTPQNPLTSRLSATYATQARKQTEEPSGGRRLRPALRILGYVVFVGMLTTIAATDATKGDDVKPPSEVGMDFTLPDWQEQLSNRTIDLEKRVRVLGQGLDTLWVLICGACVFLMQLGFCFFEAGAVRSGSVINIIFKNFSDCAVGAMVWWMVGYSFSFGSGSGMLGGTQSLFCFSPTPDDADFANYGHFFLSMTYMTTAATIVSGAVAERISLQAYTAIVAFVTCIGYPTVVHSLWSESGWLSPFSDNKIDGNGALDFAGSLVIHLFGGACALGFAWMIGPRKLKDNIDVFSHEGQEMVQAHNKFQQAAGTLLLWFSWFAFNAGSVPKMSEGSPIAANAMVSTAIASGTSCLCGLVVFRLYLGFYDIGHSCNSVLVGCVAITAGCGYMSPVYAPIVGFVSVFVYWGIFLLRTRLRIDDVVDAGAVHLGGGIWGGIAVGLFSDGDRIRLGTGGSASGDTYGLFLGGGGTQLYLQLLAIAVILVWTSIFVLVVSILLSKTIGTRLSEEAELKGLDVTEHHAHSYDYITRLEAERAAAVDAVRVTQHVAEAMVRFDLDYAIGYLSRPNHLAPSLQLNKAMSSLVSNLEKYRPYLPESLFVEEEVDQVESDVPPPGAKGTAAIIVADLQSVQELREVDPQQTRSMLRLYHKIAMRCVADHSGYQVLLKQERYTVAFPSLYEAARYALDLQQRLFNADWPEQLMTHPHFTKQGPWNGPRLKVGCVNGPVTLEMNFISGRCQYEGETLAQATQLCNEAVGGTVAVLSTALYDLEAEDRLSDLSSPAAVSMNNVALPGLHNAVTLQLLIPNLLVERRREVESAVRNRTDTASESVKSIASAPAISQRPRVVSNALPEKELSQSLATIAQVRMGSVSSADCVESMKIVNGVLQAVLDSLERTEGSVVSVCGTSLLASWNTVRRCVSHIDCGVRFAALASNLFDEQNLEGSRHAGLATGMTLHGRIGAQGQRFVNVFGTCVELAGHLASGAEALGTFVLTSSMPGYPLAEENPTLRGAVRPVDMWHLPSLAADASVMRKREEVAVYEINVALIYTREFEDDRAGEDSSTATGEGPWEWSPDYSSAFRQKRWQEIAKIASPVLAKVAQMIKTGTNLRILSTEDSAL